MKRTICMLAALLLCTVPGHADANIGLRTVVIDAGHGGHDPGAVSKDAKTYEKNITLDIAKALAERIRTAYPDVKVLMTRSTDVFVSLNERADIANKANADLFISIHINAAVSTNANGYSVHMMGQSSKKNTDLYEYNLNVCSRENSVILLEEDYSTKYEGFDPRDPESYIFMQLMQSAHQEQSMNLAQCIGRQLKGGPVSANRGISQDPFYVLWKTAMPSVLVELGFISNQADLTALRDKEKRAELADRLFSAFAEYKSSYDKSVDVSSEPTAQQQEGGSKAEAAAEDSSVQARQGAAPPRYGVQILAGRNLLYSKSREFLGYEPTIVFKEGMYRYIIAVSEDETQTRESIAQIKKTYPDCFLVKIEGENITRLR